MNKTKRFIFISLFFITAFYIVSCSFTTMPEGASCVIRSAELTGKNTADIFFEGSSYIFDEYYKLNSVFIINGKTITYNVTGFNVLDHEVLVFTGKITVSPEFIKGDTIKVSGTNKIHGNATFVVP